jgi:hypothetical protein
MALTAAFLALAAIVVLALYGYLFYRHILGGQAFLGEALSKENDPDQIR